VCHNDSLHRNLTACVCTIKETNDGSLSTYYFSPYGLDGPRIESRWGRNFSHLSRTALGPTQPPVQSVPGLYRGKERPERDADTSFLLVPWSRKDRAIPILPLWALRPVQSLSVCTRGALLLPLWALRPVQSLSACTRGALLLPLWALRPVQSLSACTRGALLLLARHLGPL
jgi:hypothetical protein